MYRSLPPSSVRYQAPVTQFTSAVVLAVTMMLLSGCSSIKLGYRYADWFIEYRMDSFLDLNAAQETKLESDIDAYFVWHRNTMLPVYTEMLQDVANANKEKRLCAFMTNSMDRIDRIYRQTAHPLLSILAKPFATLTTEQLEHFEEELNELTEKERTRLTESTEEERRNKRWERSRGWFEHWVGDLTAQQVLRLQRMLQATPDMRQSRTPRNQRKRIAFMKLLKTNPSATEVDGFFQQWFVNVAEDDPEFRREQLGLRKKGIENMCILESSITLPQRQALTGRIESYLRDFQDLQTP